jgi:prevent-host-death family protein
MVIMIPSSLGGIMIARKRYSVAEIKATLSERIREVEHGTTVLITRRGRPVAALVAADELERLRRLQSAGPEGGLASVAGGWKGSAELADLIDASPRRGRRPSARLD